MLQKTMLSRLLEKLSRVLAPPPPVSKELERDVRESIEQAERLIAPAVARGNLEFIPLLADVRALRSKAIDASFGEAVAQLREVFPYIMDQYTSPTWSDWHDPKFLARLRREGASFGASPSPAADAINRALGQIHACTARALFVPTPEILAAAAAADPTERTLDVGRHRLYFLKVEHGGGFVIDDGWYVPAGRALHAVVAPEQDYVIVETERFTRTSARSDASGGLYLVDAQRYRWTRLLPGGDSRTRLEQLEFDAEGVWIPLVEPSGAQGRTYRRYAAETFTPCARR